MVELEDPGQRRWGFELTDLGGGAFTITDNDNTQLSNVYVKQTSQGTFNGTMNGPVSWSVEWVAPADPPDSIIFYAAGNAADGNRNTQGDYIYTASFISHRRLTDVADGADMPEVVALSNYPNPFNASTNIAYQVQSPGEVRLEIFDIGGRKIGTLVNDYQQAGSKSINWDASEFSSGIYFYRLTQGGYSSTRTMTLLK